MASSDARYVYSEARIKVCYEYIDEIWKDLPTETTARGVAPIDAIVGRWRMSSFTSSVMR